MANTDAFATIRRARSLHERHDDVPASVIAVGLCLATYADGRWGINIRPGHERVARETALHADTVRVAIRWLEEHDELRCDKRGQRGSAACYTWLGVGEITPCETGETHVSPGLDGNSPGLDAPTNPTSREDPSEPSGPNSGPSWKACKRHADELIEPGYFCIKCREEDYWAEHGGRP